MLVVETIGRIRREHLVKGKSIKEIARDLNISRNTVRKVLRSGETSFSYEREVQPRPKLGRWKAEIDRLLTANVERTARERLTLIRIVRGTAGAGLRRRLRRCSPLRPELEPGACGPDGGGLCAAVVRAGRSLPVRLEPRDRRDERRDGDREGRACPPVPQPHDVRSRLSARDAGDGVRRARARLRVVQGRLHTRHLRQHEDGGGDDLHRQGPAIQSPLPADVRASSGGSGRLHAGLGLGEGPGGEPGRPGARALLHPAVAVQELRRTERLADR